MRKAVFLAQSPDLTLIECPEFHACPLLDRSAMAHRHLYFYTFYSLRSKIIVGCFDKSRYIDFIMHLNIQLCLDT
jgi:hypothetical protein